MAVTLSCKESVGHCEHGRERSKCKECGGSQICEHGREHSCKECGGSQICEHGRIRSRCKVGGSICSRSYTLSVQGMPRGENRNMIPPLVSEVFH